MTDDTPKALIVVVCTANVCRSPLVESILRQRLRDASGPLAGMAVHSAGVRADPGQPMCRESATEAADEAFTLAHRATRLDVDVVRSAALVLTAEREHRGAAARLAPGSQAKVFTFLEATALAGVAADRVRAGAVEPPADAAGIAALLHGCRGMVSFAAPQPARRRLFRGASAPQDPLDLADGHGQAPDVHRAAVHRTHLVGEQLAAALEDLASARPA